MLNQAYIFMIFILNGFLIGIFFDIFRVLRKSFKTSDFITYIEDILFWIFTGLSLLYTIFKFNNGEIRLYIFLGIFLGISVYLLIFSKIFININVKIINIIKKIINIIIVIPIKYILIFLRRILLKPIAFIFINIRGRMSKIQSKLINLYNNRKKHLNKKDLA